MLLEFQQWVDHSPYSRVLAVEECIICTVDAIPPVVAHQRGDLLARSWTLDEPELDEASARPAAVDPVVDLLVEKDNVSRVGLQCMIRHGGSIEPIGCQGAVRFLRVDGGERIVHGGSVGPRYNPQATRIRPDRVQVKMEAVGGCVRFAGPVSVPAVLLMGGLIALGAVPEKPGSQKVADRSPDPVVNDEPGENRTFFDEFLDIVGPPGKWPSAAILLPQPVGFARESLHFIAGELPWEVNESEGFEVGLLLWFNHHRFGPTRMGGAQE